MREVCREMLTAAADMPDSLVVSATASEITAECATFTSLQQLAHYVRKFSNRADTLSAAQVRYNNERSQTNWRYVALVVVLWRPALSSSSSAAASVTALR